MESVALFKPKFSGQRFDDHTLPFELLDDLSFYQDLLHHVAKDIYYKQNDSKRVPKGFGQGVYLKLGKIEDGSALAPILLAASTFFLPGDVNSLFYFERAQQDIVCAISAADNDQDISGILSPDALAYFNKIGKNLKEDEIIDFAPNSVTTSRLTQINRRKIALASPIVSAVESEMFIRGNIIAIGKAPYQFTVQTKDQIKLPVIIDEIKYKVVEGAYLEYENNVRVLIACTGVYNKQNKLESIKEINDIVILDKKDVPTQLESFLNIEEGWNGGEGVVYSKGDLLWLSNQFDNYISRDLLLPYTFPTVEGGVQFEWVKNNDDATLEVNLKEKTSYLHYYNSATEDEISEDIILSTQEGWSQLNTILSKYFKA